MLEVPRSRLSSYSILTSPSCLWGTVELQGWPFLFFSGFKFKLWTLNNLPQWFEDIWKKKIAKHHGLERHFGITQPSTLCISCFPWVQTQTWKRCAMCSLVPCAGGRILQFHSFSTSHDLNVNVCTTCSSISICTWKPMASIHPQEHISQEVRALRARSFVFISSLALVKHFLSKFVIC